MKKILFLLVCVLWNAFSALAQSGVKENQGGNAATRDGITVSLADLKGFYTDDKNDQDNLLRFADGHKLSTSELASWHKRFYNMYGTAKTNVTINGYADMLTVISESDEVTVTQQMLDAGIFDDADLYTTGWKWNPTGGTDGKGKVEYTEKKYTLRVGDVLFIHKGVYVWGKGNCGNGMQQRGVLNVPKKEEETVDIDLIDKNTEVFETDRGNIIINNNNYSVSYSGGGRAENHNDNTIEGGTGTRSNSGGDDPNIEIIDRRYYTNSDGSGQDQNSTNYTTTNDQPRNRNGYTKWEAQMLGNTKATTAGVWTGVASDWLRWGLGMAGIGPNTGSTYNFFGGTTTPDPSGGGFTPNGTGY